MFPTFDWTNFLQGLVPSIQQYLPKQPATFITPLTPPKSQLTVAPSLGTPAANIATAPLGQAQGGLGATPKSTPKYGLGAAPPPIPGIGGQSSPQNGASFTRAQQRGLQRNAQYSSPPSGTPTPPLAPEDIMPQYSGFVSPSTTGGMATDVFGQPLINPVNNMPVPNAPQAFTTNPQTGMPEFLYDANGNPIASTLTGFQAQQAGLSPEELAASGYVQFGGTNGIGGTWIYNPVGGAAAQQQQNNLPWWQQGQTWAGGQSFSSEKKANQAYAEQKRRERDAAKKKNPNRPNWNKKKGESGGGVTTATSFMGTG